MRIKSCPFCGGNASVSYKQGEYMGQNVYGDKKLKYRVQVICNRCHSRGKPATTDWIINPRPKERPEELKTWADKAVEAWNNRKE